MAKTLEQIQQEFNAITLETQKAYDKLKNIESSKEFIKKNKAAYEAAKAERIKVITDALGIDAATLEAKRKAGQTLAAIAGDKKDALIAALVAYESKKIDAAVADGKLSAERATALKSKLTAGITAMVNKEAKIGKAFKGFGKKGHGRGGK